MLPRFSRCWLLFAWSVALLVLVLIGLSLCVLPGLILLAVTPFVLLAVADGRQNPIAANMRVIGARWARWLVTLLMMGIICLGLWLLGATDGFFVTGAPGGFIAWLAFGLVSAWFIGAWALLYRSVLADGQEPGPA